MARKPILPTNLGDPMGTAAKVRQADAEFKRRIRECKRAYLAVLDKIEFDEITINAKRYEFRILPAVLTQLLEDTGRLVDTILGAINPRNWFALNYVLPAYEKGATMTWRNLGAQSAEYKATKPVLSALLQSAPYQNRLGLLQAREFEEMKGLSANVKQGLAQQLTAGLAQGIGPLEIAKNITVQTGIEERRAERIARTEINQALRTARMDETQDAQQRLGILVKVLHLSALSPTTRVTHAARSGQIFTVEEERDWFAEGANAINCFVPGTRVAGRFLAGSKSRYHGPTVKLVTADGSDLTITPNHPVMTARGLLPAAKVLESDYLVAHCDKIEDPAGVVALNGQAIEPLIEQVFTTLSDLGHPFRAGVRAVDFHGDAAFMDQDIEVVRADRVLMCAIDAQQAQALDRIAFEHANAVGSSAQGALFENVGAIDLTSPGSLSGRGIDSPGVEAHLCSPCESSSTPIVGLKASRGEPPHDDGAGNAESFSNRLDRLAGLVRLVKVVEIWNGEFSGHVYDLEEESGLMIANGLIVSNCKCTSSEVLVDENGQPRFTGLIDQLRAASDEWEKKNAVTVTKSKSDQS